MFSTRPEKVRKLFEKITSGQIQNADPKGAKKRFSFPPFFSKFRTVFSGKPDISQIKKLVLKEEKLVRKLSRDVSSAAQGIPGAAHTPNPVRIDNKSKQPGKSFSKFPAWGWLLIISWLVTGASLFLFFRGQGNSHSSSQILVIESARSKEQESVLQTQEQTIAFMKKQIEIMTIRLREAKQMLDKMHEGEEGYREEAYQQAIRYQQEIDVLQKSITARESVVRELESKLETAMKTAEHFKTLADRPVPVAEVPMGAMPEGLPGKVVMVNSRYEFVIIDIGARHGVRPGQRVSFVRAGEIIAFGRVEQVYPGVAGVLLSDSSDIEWIREGTQVFVKVS